MKINFKHVAATAMAVAMSLSLAAPAFAAGNGGDKTLTVTGDTLDNKKVYAVQMFDARLTEGTSNTFDNYELVNAEKWLKFFTAGTEAGGMGLTDLDEDLDTDADDARAYLEKLASESTEVKAFADKAQAWVRNHSTDFTVIASDTEREPVADQETFTDLKPGYYLVYPEGGSTGNGDRGTDAMLVNVPTNGNAVWNMKSTFPTVDKTVEDNNENTTGDGANGSAQVGDTVTFTLKSTVPDMSDYNKFYFAFHDTLTKGLELVTVAGTFAETDVEVYIYKEDSETADEDHKVSVNDFDARFEAGGKKLDVVFDDLRSVKVGQDPGNDIETGDTIVVKYRAKITEAAVSGSDNIFGAAENSVSLEYSNNPSTEGTGTSTPDTSKVYTYDITVDKYELVKDAEDSDQDGSKEDMIEQGLAGATFVLSTSETLQGTGPYSYTNAIAITKDNTQSNTFHVDPNGGNTYEFMTVANGDITIEGLEAGTYFLHEVAAPNGYNKLKDPVKIEIIVDAETAATYAPDGNEDKYNNVSFENPLYVVNGTANATANDATIKVENKKGIELPETGSIGTIGLTVAGVAIVLLGVFAPRKKKKSNQE